MKRAAALFLSIALLFLSGCAGNAPDSAPVGEEAVSPAAAEPASLEVPGLTVVSAMEKQFATQFDVYYCEGGYKYILIGEDRYLTVPEGAEVPAGLDAEVTLLPQPLENIYLAATGAMALFDAMDALSAVRLAGRDASGWYIANAVEALERGDMLFAGKYSEPDYELLLDSNCSLAIENTMISHTPKVKETLEMLGIPVLVERSSYESHPLGRTEWIKLYAALLDREQEAEEVFARKAAVMDMLRDFPNTGKTIALFYVDSSGAMQVRSSDDYISKIFVLAGGRNAFSDLTIAESGRANVNITMEQFYATAMDADYLIYNSSISGAEVDTVEKMLEKCPLLFDCRAVLEGNVWWLGEETYQYSDRLDDLIRDVHRMLTGETGEMIFLHHMEGQ